MDEWLSFFFRVTLLPYDIGYWFVAVNDLTAGFAMIEPLACSRAH
jgi:hypothetical protein